MDKERRAVGGPNFPFQSAGCGIAAASRPPQNGFQRGNETKRTNPLPAPQLNRPIGGGLFRPPPQVLRSPPNTTSHSRQRELSAHLIPDCQRGLIAAPPPAMRSRWIFFSDFSWPLCRLQLSSVKQCPNLPGLVRGSCPKSRTVRIGRTGRFESSGTPTPPRSGIEPVLTGPFLPIKPGRRSNRCWRKPESPESPT